jgi:DNA polymerase-3 subunit gamma/tau
MSIITKYRPNVWGDVIGQSSIVRSIQKAIKEDKSHVFLFTGASGLGKTTIARLTSKSLGVEPANLLELDAATHSSVEDTRAIIETLPYNIGGKKRGILIDEIHAISKSAWESLLKSIEEPPEWVYWFLCTTELTKVPKTIKTRALHYDLKPVGTDDLVDWLDPIAKKEGGSDFVGLCAAEAKGSPRQALSNLAAVGAAKDEKEARDLLKSAEEDPQVIDLCRALLNNKPWRDVQKLLAGMKDKDAESIRRVVCAYMTSVACSVPKESIAGRAIEVIDAFADPMYASAGISLVVRACGVCCLSSG